MFRFSGFAFSVGLLAPLGAFAQDASQWAGFNGGFLASVPSGTQSFTPGGTFDITGDGIGIFAGYLLANGAWAYGGEISYSSTDYIQKQIGGAELEFPEYNYNHTLDLKARLGYAVERAMLYGVVGYGFSEWQEGNLAELYNVEGAIFGLGVDYLVSDRVFLGGEILRREMDANPIFNADVTTFSLRVGMKF